VQPPSGDGGHLGGNRVNILSILLGIVIAVFIGALFFRFRPSNSYRRLGLCIFVSLIGFAAGDLLAEWLGLRLLNAGSLNLVGAIPGSLIALIALQVLSLKEWK
jgi:uncharacterized transporter YbjL